MLYLENDDSYESTNDLARHILNYLAKVARSRAKIMVSKFTELNKNIVYPKGEEQCKKAETIGFKILDTKNVSLEELVLAHLILENASNETDRMAKKYKKNKPYVYGKNWYQDSIRHEKYGKVSK